MVTNLPCISDKGGYSDMQVLRSPAGWYIGTIYTGPDGFMEPGSRDSDYFETREEAEQALGALSAMGDDFAADVLRKTP
jgi:hypothetical protein